MNNRFDSWKNLLTGLGSSRDKSSHHHFLSDNSLSYDYLEQLYLNDDIVARICDLVPNEILRQGFVIKVNDEDFAYENLVDIVRDALLKSRIFGAAFIFMGINDGQPQDKPLNLAKIKGLKFLHVLTPKDLKKAYFYDDITSQKYGQTEYYYLKQNLIHETRLLPFFSSTNLDPKKFPSSILQRIYPVLQQFHTAWQSTSHLMTDAAQGVFKLKGLHSAMASNRSEELLKRMELVDMSRSVSRSILLDAEDEDFRRDAYSFGGIPEILEKMMLRLAAAARIPVSLLMGQAPAGMNATGESDIRFFYDQIKEEQEFLKSKITHLVKIILGDEKALITIEFPALWQPTELQKLELKRLEAEIDKIYLQEGVLLPEEVALKRFKNTEFSIDIASREDLVEDLTD